MDTRFQLFGGFPPSHKSPAKLPSRNAKIYMERLPEKQRTICKILNFKLIKEA